MKDIETIEKIQKRATKHVKQIRHLIYFERLKRLNLPTLRRHRGDMIEVYKILHNRPIYDKEVTTGIQNLSSNTSTRGHSLKLTTQRSRLELRRNSFAVRVVKPWNSLSEEVVMSPSVRVFESRLDNMWNNQLMKFNYRSSSASSGRIWTASYVQHTPMMTMKALAKYTIEHQTVIY